MVRRDNVKIILIDGTVHDYDEPLHIPRNEHTEELYQTLLSMNLTEEKPA